MRSPVVIRPQSTGAQLPSHTPPSTHKQKLGGLPAGLGRTPERYLFIRESRYTSRRRKLHSSIPSTLGAACKQALPDHARLRTGSFARSFGATSVANSSSEASAFSTPYHGG